MLCMFEKNLYFYRKILIEWMYTYNVVWEGTNVEVRSRIIMTGLNCNCTGPIDSDCACSRFGMLPVTSFPACAYYTISILREAHSIASMGLLSLSIIIIGRHEKYHNSPKPRHAKKSL